MITTEVKKEFDALNKESQWIWLLNCSFKEKLIIKLDNDSTYIEIEGADEYLSLKADIGDREGVHLLFKAIGIYCESV